MSETSGDFAAHPFAMDLPAAARERIAECVLGTGRWTAGESMCREGGIADACLLIMHGDVSVEVHSPGRPPRVLQTLSDGDVLGWSWLFPPYRWTFDAHARTDTEAIRLDGARLRELMAEDREFGYEVLLLVARLVVQRLNATRLQLLDLYADRT